MQSLGLLQTPPKALCFFWYNFEKAKLPGDTARVVMATCNMYSWTISAHYVHTNNHGECTQTICYANFSFTLFLQPEDVDIVCVSLEMAVASVGGFCAGKSYVIDHQRLSGLGYCFSASVPPMLASAAMESLTVMKTQTDMFEKVRQNARSLRQKLKG